jgi:hypothetical protein
MSHNYGNNQRRSKRTSGIRRGRKYRKARQYGGANTKGTENYQNDLMWEFYIDRDLTNDPTVWDRAKVKIEAKTAAPTGVTDMLNLTNEIKEIWTKHSLTDVVTYGTGQPVLTADKQYEKIKMHKFMIALILKQYDYINFHAGPLPALSTIRRNLIKSFADENDATKVNQINSFVWDETDKARNNNTATIIPPKKQAVTIADFASSSVTEAKQAKSDYEIKVSLVTADAIDWEKGFRKSGLSGSNARAEYAKKIGKYKADPLSIDEDSYYKKAGSAAWETTTNAANKKAYDDALALFKNK